MKSNKINCKTIRNNIDVIILSVLWISLFAGIFYKGSVNVGMWGQWEDFEIVFPLLISLFISSIIMIPIYLLSNFFKNKGSKSMK